MDIAQCLISCFEGLFVSLPLLGSSLEECSKNVKKQMETMTLKKEGQAYDLQIAMIMNETILHSE